MLVIVPCGKAKVWDEDPSAGATCAMHAYTGAPFAVNREYAKKIGDDWVVLSAKHGFLRPHDVVPENYDTTFKRPSTRPISTEELRRQVRRMRLGEYREVTGLGGKEYRAAIQSAFAGTAPVLHFPFAGLPIGEAMKATKQATVKAQ